jgi:hypothetical protein
MKHTDKLGTEIKVGDIVVSGGGKYANIHIGMVTKRNPTMVRVGQADSVNPSECLIVTDKYKTEFPEKYQKMYDKSKGLFEGDAKKPNPTMRYLIEGLSTDKGGKVALVIKVLADRKELTSISVEDVLVKFKYSYDKLQVIRKAKGYTLTDELAVARSGWPDRKYLEIPAKAIKKLFGEVPDTTSIIDLFDSMTVCKLYLKALGVSV